jgi:hypothetical protein
MHLATLEEIHVCIVMHFKASFFALLLAPPMF